MATISWLTAVEVHVVAETAGKGRDRPFAVVAGAIEAAVDGPLHPAADRLEEREDHERGDRDRDGSTLVGRDDPLGQVGEQSGREHDHADEHDAEDAGDRRVRQRPADDPVDVVQVVAQDGDADRDRDQGAQVNK